MALETLNDRGGTRLNQAAATGYHRALFACLSWLQEAPGVFSRRAPGR